MANSSRSIIKFENAKQKEYDKHWDDEYSLKIEWQAGF